MFFNRGVEKRTLYLKREDFTRFKQTCRYYQFGGSKPKFSSLTDKYDFSFLKTSKQIQILGYCFMPNHFHLLLKQIEENGITQFLSQLSNSYTKFFNKKYDRVGPLLQGTFKAVPIENDEQLLHVLRYIHLNPVTSFLVERPEDYPWSSYREYMEIEPNPLCFCKELMTFFANLKDFF